MRIPASVAIALFLIPSVCLENCIAAPETACLVEQQTMLGGITGLWSSDDGKRIGVVQQGAAILLCETKAWGVGHVYKGMLKHGIAALTFPAKTISDIDPALPETVRRALIDEYHYIFRAALEPLAEDRIRVGWYEDEVNYSAATQRIRRVTLSKTPSSRLFTRLSKPETAMPALPDDWVLATSSPPQAGADAGRGERGTWLTPTEIKDRPQDLEGVWTTPKAASDNQIQPPAQAKAAGGGIAFTCPCARARVPESSTRPSTKL
jgi:hypothetical protein